MDTKKFCLALDLKNDPNLISEYENHHRAVWPGILESIRDSGVVSMEIFRWENRLFMIMETQMDFSFETKSKMDAANPKVQEWETHLWKYQQGLPGTKKGAKWQLMDRIFNWSSE
ncbi:L-rhamnose mutarotase [Rhodonellum sp.]|uniref:L-rhamnose mutarotase n=1 Tax=Rhodonellum sp. TaxID=2231180 RepID=UPI00272246F0|nr:L-rhamnose mutarotase [Rhodonellum sp.]MDO9554097.1 L-rhamnose mutarotase [Rhodonellum sp.]